MKIICENRKARHDYEIIEKLEAGMVLKGSEVKALRAGKAQLVDSYADIQKDEIWLLKAHFAPHGASPYDDHEPTRKRKLLLHRQEINKLVGKIKEKGLTLIPLKLYFKNGHVKVELALCRSKSKGDKRQSLKLKDANKQMKRELKHSR